MCCLRCSAKWFSYTNTKIWSTSWICMLYLCRGHANLLCIIPILVSVLLKQALVFFQIYYFLLVLLDTLKYSLEVPPNLFGWYFWFPVESNVLCSCLCRLLLLGSLLQRTAHFSIGLLIHWQCQSLSKYLLFPNEWFLLINLIIYSFNKYLLRDFCM